MSDVQIWFSGNNDMVIEVDKVTDKITGLPIDDATINATLKDEAGVDVGGITWPQVLDFVSSGLYRKTIDKAAAVVNGVGYTLFLVLTTPTGGDAEWEILVGGDTRKA